MEFKKVVIILVITTIVSIGLLFGTSYAWYAYKNAETSIEGKTKEEAPTVIFSQTEYLYSKETMPIQDEDRYNYGNKNSFIITLGENLSEYQTGIEISLKDIAMASELKIPNYKYELLQNGTAVASGSFENIGSSRELMLMPMTELQPTSYPETYSYELYIWLSDDGTDQNELMNKGFRAKINVTSATKKQKEGSKMNKKIAYSVGLVLLIVIAIVGSTYAYFTSIATSTNSNVVATAEKYEIVYHGGTAINADLKTLASHVGADNTTVEIGLASGVNDSVNATLFISPEIATDGFKWEVYRISGNTEILEGSGNFQGATNNSEVTLITKPLTTTMTSYKVYFWLDGDKTGNEIIGKTFSGYIGARSDILTGIVDNS